MSEFGFRTYSCSHRRIGTEPCGRGCHDGERDRIVIPPARPPSPEATCPACLSTGLEHTHGCKFCGGWECGCEAYREAIEDAAKLAESDGQYGLAERIRALVKNGK